VLTAGVGAADPERALALALAAEAPPGAGSLRC
jgi:hypothetical protein